MFTLFIAKQFLMNICFAEIMLEFCKRINKSGKRLKLLRLKRVKEGSHLLKLIIAVLTELSRLELLKGVEAHVILGEA
jgi:hypothetical protein